MKILDCDSLDSIYNSLKHIIGASREEILELLDFDIESYYESNPGFYGTGDALLLNMLKNKYDADITINQTYWFHLTRTLEASDWSKGILPLQMMIDKIWECLFVLVGNGFSKKEWLSFKKDVESSYNHHSAHLYRLKVAGEIHWGPYAMLIKDIAFRADEVGNHDYLQIPEIVEDICTCFEDRYNDNLLLKYIKNTRPCIVKFISNGGKPTYIGNTLFFLYNSFHGLEMCMHCNSCFDNYGEPVSANSIKSIEFF